MFNLFDTCLHYLEARVYHSMKKTDLRTEAIHLKSLPHRSYSTNKAPAPWFKILLDKTNLDKKPAHTNYVFFMFRNHEHFLKMISCLGPGLGFEQNMTAGRSLFISIFFRLSADHFIKSKTSNAHKSKTRTDKSTLFEFLRFTRKLKLL